MIISSLLFDVVLFGALLIAVVVDAVLPGLAGAVTLVVVAAAVYVAAGEFAGFLGKRENWTQEALSTGMALSALFFIYWWWRNPSDLSLLTLSIILMMTALMLTIAIISCINAMWNQKSAMPLAGFALTAMGGIILGILAGPLTLAFAATYKVLAIIIGLVIWKARERIKPPPGKDVLAETPETLAGERWVLLPSHGTLLGRLLPVIMVGALLMVAAHQWGQSAALPVTPSLASPTKGK